MDLFFCLCDTTDMERYQQARQRNIETLQTRGLEILSPWDGRLGSGKQSAYVPVTVRNTACGHTFTSSAKNLITRGVTCPTCAKHLKTGNINAWSEMNSARWRRTAPEWRVYRSEVTKLTRITYKTHNATINPNNLPFGRAGTEGAHHLDHIVSVRYGFENGIPPAELAQASNLRVIPWLENVVKRDRILDNKLTDGLSSSAQSGRSANKADCRACAIIEAPALSTNLPRKE